MDLDTRIKQFEELCAEDPGNDMAHFSLAGAYAQAGRTEDALAAYRRCIEANGQMSKAYQLAGQALKDLGRTEDAADMLETGYRVAAARGDTMPKQAMADLLTELGREVPATRTDARDEAPPGTFLCGKTGRPGTQMDRAPFRGDLGAWILENISKETFDEWIGLGTKVINELKLDLSQDEHDAVYDYAMRRYLGITQEITERFEGDTWPEPGQQYREVVETILLRMGEIEDFGGKMDESLSS